MLVQYHENKQDTPCLSTCKDVRSWYSSFFVLCLQGQLVYSAVPTLSWFS